MDAGTAIIWKDEAKEDLRDIIHNLVRLPTAYVDEWSNELTRKLDMLAVHPQIGRQVPEKEITDLREVFVGRYRLIYLYLNNLITILAIRPMGRPLGKL